MEFLLANHPLDCPICDQGGECDLQVDVHRVHRFTSSIIMFLHTSAPGIPLSSLQRSLPSLFFFFSDFV